ncbi:AfsR/SARP family transcriptional regulator [Streptomyces sp. UNOC14_S4]|uniref:AfsR/SARP family transcriptional regulator n=1 Tax=Streptomyces sp. UNOC14_S4 TaxID=2872340 RepID=UPI001E312930|nr:AfsR/SARP family transcriptional regulator [Streptomyces sp. UNOC14_S4]MCC3770842.1 AfsR/SARP family transcriptional regulator [Streptomyces sp. UNOC14_S4]
MQFNLIGPFEIVTDDGRRCVPSTPKVFQTLAFLLTRPRDVAPVDLLVQELWGKNPPRTALTTLQTYIYQARRMLVSEGLAKTGRDLVVRRSPGYLIDVEDDVVDSKIFERLVTLGQDDLREDRPERTLEHLDRALALWRGPVLSDIPAGDILAGRIARLEELRIWALELRIEAEHRLGRQRETIPHLRMLVSEFPLHEWFHGRLIAALHASGRRAEALQSYRDLRRILDEELGVEPAPEIQQLQQEMLSPRPPAPQDSLTATGRRQPNRLMPLWTTPDLIW